MFPRRHTIHYKITAQTGSDKLPQWLIQADQVGYTQGALAGPTRSTQAGKLKKGVDRVNPGIS